MNPVQYIFLILLLLLCVLLLLAILAQMGNRGSSMRTEELLEQMDKNMENSMGRLGKTLVVNARRLTEGQTEIRGSLGEGQAQFRTEVSGILTEGQRTQNEQLTSLMGVVNETMGRIEEKQQKTTEAVDGKLSKIAETVDGKLDKMAETVDGKLDKVAETVDGKLDKVAETVNERMGRIEEKQQKTTETVDGKLSKMAETVDGKLDKMTETVDGKLDKMTGTVDEKFDKITETVDGKLDKMTGTVDEKFDKITGTVDGKLDKITGVVDQKLDETLNRRLDENFKQVGDQLGQLYKTLGELEHLSTGVTDLNRTLSNVKTRGIFGEVQLGRILQETMAASQYETNVATKQGSDDRVEYAVRFPAQDGSGEVVLLPIDAKFPSDIYNKVVDASANGDQVKLLAAQKELRGRVQKEARDIRDKYLDVPRTTAYGILFLPTEGLYAEVLRLDGLSEECQRNGVILAGPTTITALLNSLQAGFRNIALSKKSVEIMRLLEAVKTQFAKMDEAITKTRKKLGEAEKATEDMQRRTQIIQRRMRGIGEMDKSEAKRILEQESPEDGEGDAE